MVLSPLMVLTAPAGVSTACDDLKERLNQVRINDLNRSTHERLAILESAMANVNHGQGVGFSVFGYVIDKNMLIVMAAKLGAGEKNVCTNMLAH
jgi:hypothetical protein